MKKDTKKSLISSNFPEVISPTGICKKKLFRYTLSTFILGGVLTSQASSTPAVSGEQSQSSKIESVVSSPNSKAKITFSLYNAETDKPIKGFDPIQEDAVINISEVGKSLKVVMKVQGMEQIGSVQLGLNESKNFQLETKAPFAVKLDYNEELMNNGISAWAPVLGKNEIKATFFTENLAKGEVIKAVSIRFKVIDDILLEPSSELINAFPNPATDELNVSFKEKAEGTYKLIDPSGAVVQSGEIMAMNDALKLNVQNLKPGIYYIQLLTDGKTSTKKIFIK